MLNATTGWTVLSRPGLVPDDGIAALSAMAIGPVHVRLIIGEVGQTCACCIGTPPVIVAVSTNDPSLPEGLGRALLAHGSGVALATADADHLDGTLLVTEFAAIPVRRTAIDSGGAVVVHFADALPLLAGTPELVTVAVLHRRPGASLPPTWSAETDRAGAVAVTAGCRPVVAAPVGA